MGRGQASSSSRGTNQNSRRLVYCCGGEKGIRTVWYNMVRVYYGSTGSPPLLYPNTTNIHPLYARCHQTRGAGEHGNWVVTSNTRNTLVQDRPNEFRILLHDIRVTIITSLLLLTVSNYGTGYKCSVKFNCMVS
eukprot:scaffold10537_cov145-Amphora_coffeaeformis.AAC.1